jgi:hypothetical protein
MKVVAICCCLLFIYFLDYLTAKVQSGFGPKTLFQINNLSRKPTKYFCCSAAEAPKIISLLALSFWLPACPFALQHLLIFTYSLQLEARTNITVLCTFSPVECLAFLQIFCCSVAEATKIISLLALRSLPSTQCPLYLLLFYLQLAARSLQLNTKSASPA